MPQAAFNDVIKRSFDDLSKRLNGSASGPLHKMREAALKSFIEQGVPTTRHEEWKYANVLPFIGLEYSRVSEIAKSVTEKDIDEALGELVSVLESGWRVTIVNGQFRGDLSYLPAAVTGVSVDVLSDKLIANDEVVRAAYGSVAKSDAHPFVAMNTALACDGVVIRVAKGSEMKRPLHIAIISDARQVNVLTTPRILIVAEEGSEIDIVETHSTIGDQQALDVSVSEIAVGSNAHVRFHKVADDQDDSRHIGYTAATVARDGRFTSHCINIAGNFIRNDLVINLAEVGSQAYLYGASVLGGVQFADSHTVVDHAVNNCHSEELYKGIYDGSSIGVFNGKIFVRPQAQKTTAYQSNHSVLLSDKAQVNAKPQLEIWADDVKCSHGATLGQLNDEAIFYLRSRGIDADKARALMTYAFVAEVLEHIDHEGLREFCEKRVASKLGTEPLSL